MRYGGLQKAMHQAYSNQELERLAECCRVRMKVLEPGGSIDPPSGGAISGDFDTYSVGNDLSVCTARGWTTCDLRAVLEVPRGLFVGVVTKGTMQFGLNSKQGRRTVRQGGGVVVSVSEAAELRTETAADCAFEGLSIFLDETWFDRLEELAGDNPDDRIRVRQLSKSYLVEYVAGSSGVSLLAAELMKSSRNLGLLGRLHRESITLDILGGMLRPIMRRNHAFSPSLRRTDVEIIERAQEIILSRLNNPPTLSSLSTELGINVTKLKTQFPMVFGETVFEFIHSRRMALARQLLSGRYYNVSQIAFFLGYKSPTNFSTAFRKYYGVRPKDILH